MNRVTATGIPEREFVALKAFFLRTTIPLVYESGDTVGVQGTGCLYETETGLYFVTAGHVLEGVDPSKLGIPLRQVNSEVFTLGQGVVAWSKSDGIDVGVYRIDDVELARQLREGYVILTPANSGEPLPYQDHYVVAGYPRATVPLVGRTLSPKDLTQLHTGPYDGDVIGNRTSADLFLKLDQTAQSLWGQDITVPVLGGISGGPVWQVVPNTGDVWSPEASLRLVGIQVSCKSERYVRALRWAAVKAAIDKVGAKAAGSAV
jgi:hypothetical protein